MLFGACCLQPISQELYVGTSRSSLAITNWISCFPLPSLHSTAIDMKTMQTCHAGIRMFMKFIPSCFQNMRVFQCFLLLWSQKLVKTRRIKTKGLTTRETRSATLAREPQNPESHHPTLRGGLLTAPPDHHQAMGKVAKIHNNASAARELDMS